jgi:hypothetical protein
VRVLFAAASADPAELAAAHGAPVGMPIRAVEAHSAPLHP